MATDKVNNKEFAKFLKRNKMSADTPRDMFLSFPKVKQIIEYGEQAAMDALPRIRELITRSSSGNPMPKQQ